ncbi:AAA-domain-containing protein [Periconia macrospinosa]|uniref:Vesicular-fusion protein SEC18 n=1 Tax=Periconia macrospinosa TaxID=97972 RepID=A0A2V1DGE4_9PLEO|nr:AAA-domain-containing protein [Periconia macrospinosa]
MAAHASNVFIDLSGVSMADFDNPYDALIQASNQDPVQLQERYEQHRTTRNFQQKAKILDESFTGPSIDPILRKLNDPTIEPGFEDHRHCLVFWGRPTEKVKDLIARVQQELHSVLPHLWLMPRDNLHITALEITHSKTAEEIEGLVEIMQPKVPFITNYTFTHQTRLIKPMIGYDASALALSFVPAAGEDVPAGRSLADDNYTYHHLRRDLFNLCKDTGVAVDSRYVVPSSHLTIGRFIDPRDFANGTVPYDPHKMEAFIQKIEEINEWLQNEFWPEFNDGKIPDGGQWIVGEEKGLHCRMGRLCIVLLQLDNMFNRDRVPGLPGSSPRPPQGYGRPPQQQQPPPPQQSPGYGRDPRMGGGYPGQPPQVQGYGQQMPSRVPAPGGGGGGTGGERGGGNKQGPKKLRPIKSPGGNAYVFSNLVAVNPDNFEANLDGSDVYIRINDDFVVSARPTQACPKGEIGLTDPQRSWAKISLGPQDVVVAEPYDPFSQGGQSYLGNITVEVGFASPRRTTDTPYDPDELGSIVKKNFENQILAPGQILLIDVRSIVLKLVVKTVQLVDLSMEKTETASGAPLTDINARGILTRHTEMDFFKDATVDIKLKSSSKRPAANAIVQPGFKFEDMGIGGLDTEFSAIFRRAFASRIFPPGLVEKLGIQHVRGILLYGPPGTGKTLIARQIGKMLNAREPKVINGPEVLNKYVGQSEENIRKLFADAEKEYKEKGDESGLHIIIFDELDAVCKQRGSGTGGTGVGDSVVNQLLSKLDGVDQLNNILLIGMTNRMDMIDEALLRAGRLEVHMEISLPDEAGRAQILKIHTTKMRNNNVIEGDVNVEELAKLTKNFSGAEINGLVKAASSFAFNRHIKVGTMAAIDPNVENMKVSRQDFLNALEEVKPLFGAAEEELEKRLLGGIMHFSPFINNILEDARLYINQVRKGSTPVLSVALHGPPGSGKTALAAKMAIDSGFPFIKLISPEDMVGFSEMQKVQQLDKTFRDAYKSPLSIVVIDNVELLVDWVPIGARFSNTVLVALKVLLGKQPPKDRRLLIFATTTERSVLQQLDLFSRFDADIAVPNVNSQNELAHILRDSGAFSDRDQQRAIGEIQEITGSAEVGVGIKRILTAIKTAQEDQDVPGRFARIMSSAIAANRGSYA